MPASDLRISIGAADVMDVFVYVVVLNLAMEYFSEMISETFTISLLTAVVLKAVLEVVFALKSRLKARFRAARTGGAKVVTALMMWALMVGSKFAVLKLTELVFGDRVSLGGFFQVTGLILALMLARAGVRRLVTV